MNGILKSILAVALAIGVVACTPKEKNAEVSVKQVVQPKLKRYGSVIKVKPELLDQYKELHAHTWSGVLEQISESNIRNYSIYLKDDYLFAYFEYVGDNFEKDMVKMAEDSTTQAWWKLTDPMQLPLETRKEGEWWASMEEVFHTD